MTTYELPEQPPVGTVLYDKNGNEWKSPIHPDWWRRVDNGEVREWFDLLRFGPLTTEPTAPPLGTFRWHKDGTGWICRGRKLDGGEPCWIGTFGEFSPLDWGRLGEYLPPGEKP